MNGVQLFILSAVCRNTSRTTVRARRRSAALPGRPAFGWITDHARLN